MYQRRYGGKTQYETTKTAANELKTAERYNSHNKPLLRCNTIAIYSE